MIVEVVGWEGVVCMEDVAITVGDNCVAGVDTGVIVTLDEGVAGVNTGVIVMLDEGVAGVNTGVMVTLDEGVVVVVVGEAIDEKVDPIELTTVTRPVPLEKMILQTPLLGQHSHGVTSPLMS
jgi:hypothetical protein